MPKYHLTYTGGSMPETQEERDAAMAAWGAWYEELGAAVADPGNPVAASATIAADGSVGGPGAVSGYTILTASDLDDAVAKAKGCPGLQHGIAIEVSECMEM